jgi:phosphotransacetylase
MTYYEKNKNARLNYQKQYYQENKEEIKKYTKNYYELNKHKMKEKRKGNIPVKRKQKNDGFFLITHKDITLSFD